MGQQPYQLLIWPRCSSFALRHQPALMASGLEASEHLKCQTWVLKVSIHCEGCKKRVKKVLHRIEGVYKTTVDCQQQKVIVAGNVAVDTLVKKLFKIGKHAELWPEERPAAQDTILATAAEEKKNKKKAGKSGNPEKSSKKDHKLACDKKSGHKEGLTGHDVDKTCCTVAGKKKGNKFSTNSGDASAAASNGEAECIKVVRGIPPVQEPPNACHFPAYTSQPPACLVSYTTSYFGHHPLTGPYNIPATVPSPVSYDLFGEESTDVCSVM